MRPLYAIAPLALLLTLFGPPPHEANKVLADFMDHFLGHRAHPQLDNSTDARANKPASMGGEVVETSFSR
ncbi:hypothetical protein JY96_08065 [Aquabacterium sp. NJ1]|uniref:hypothetical protein n=1 Tax=Aquabacterium sp. NJ1 TaxID=1538295 RepID=UPI00052C50D0|nr:hypothetical protein [Aquabacterium sp. NJ1]KGM40004.1 hypothetical protein JY96_08065 [Aquabacterium sp. NJ1]